MCVPSSGSLQLESWYLAAPAWCVSITARATINTEAESPFYFTFKEKHMKEKPKARLCRTLLPSTWPHAPQQSGAGQGKSSFVEYFGVAGADLNLP